MADNRVYKLTNEFLCFGFDKKISAEINKQDHPGLSVIHVFAYDYENIDTDVLAYYSDACRRRHIKMIIHVPQAGRGYLRKKLKGVPKDQYFHLSIIKRKCYHFSAAFGVKEVFVTEAGYRIETGSAKGTFVEMRNFFRLTPTV